MAIPLVGNDFAAIYNWGNTYTDPVGFGMEIFEALENLVMSQKSW